MQCHGAAICKKKEHQSYGCSLAYRCLNSVDAEKTSIYSRSLAHSIDPGISVTVEAVILVALNLRDRERERIQ